MAIKKEFEVTRGVKGDYCKIIGVSSNSLYMSSVVKVAIYKDQETRKKDDVDFLRTILVNIPGSDHTRETAYEAIKLKSEFECGIDC